jgi:hypothetical protein
MAGIKEALIKVANGKNIGYCLHKGEFDNKSNLFEKGIIKFMIFKPMGELETHTIFDYGGDVRISDKIEDGDLVILNILDNYCAKWEKND